MKTRSLSRNVYGARTPTVLSSGAGIFVGAARGGLRPLLDFFFPDLCLACERQPATSTLSLCVHCRSALRAATASSCATCGRVLASPPSSPAARRSCGECLRRAPPWDGLLFLYDYAPPFDAVMRAFKFGQLEVLGDRFAAMAWDRYAERLAVADVVVPMPLPWTRRLVRGFNQAEAIAAPLADALGRPLDRVLRRMPTAAHSLLTRDRRRRSAASSFRLVRSRATTLSKKKVLLVDDVFTSGATMKGAAFALRRAGAEVVVAFAVARTPRAGERSRR